MNTALRHVPVGTVFQLDGAPLHSSRRVSGSLDGEFLDSWLGRGETDSAAPHFLRFTPLHFSSGVFVKSIVVYREKVQNINELHDRIS